MLYIGAALAIVTPAYLYAILPSVTLTYESTILFTLISLLSVSILAGIVALSKAVK
jgi:hypothetical protein